jgi:DNA-directed RNA polymerase subunit M/transcription elongation factor TFIIS
MKTVTLSDEQYETLENALAIAFNSISVNARGALAEERVAYVALLTHVDAVTEETPHPKRRARKSTVKRPKSLNQPPKRVAPTPFVPYQHGLVILPDVKGRCGQCGASNFTYNNGHEVAADGTRGYRCVGCGCIKPENWRELSDYPATE